MAIAGLIPLLAAIWLTPRELGAPASLSPGDLSAWLRSEGALGPVWRSW